MPKETRQVFVKMCPWCGHVPYVSIGKAEVLVLCQRAHCKVGPIARALTLDAVLDAWNGRASDSIAQITVIP
jgi:hypothetical protein